MEPTTTLPVAAPVPRRADRRLGLHTLITQMTADLATAPASADLTKVLTARLAPLARVREVTISQTRGGSPIRSGHPVVSHEYAAFAVPARTGGGHVVLEARFPPGARPDEWTCQLLQSAVCLAAWLLGEPSEGPIVVSGHAVSPEVGPLIGASEVMQALRDRVERVASTDFTILIEGPIDPQ